MAIITETLSQLITEFRALSAKDSITPETLGALLQRITDLLATAGTAESVEKIQTFVQQLKTADTMLSSIKQGQADRNHVYADIQSLNIANGTVNTSSGILIQQATTDRAGAMRAQQVIDLNNTRNRLGELDTILSEELPLLYKIIEKLGLDEECSENVHFGDPISCAVIDNTLYVYGIDSLVRDGYVPYLFRHIRKRNPYKHKIYPVEGKKYGPKRKGWTLYGSRYAVQGDGNIVKFSTGPHYFLSNPQTQFSERPEDFICQNINIFGNPTVAWGRAMIDLRDLTKENPDMHRMIKLRFGIAFGKPIQPACKRITPADMASSLAEFSIVYDSGSQRWSFSR